MKTYLKHTLLYASRWLIVTRAWKAITQKQADRMWEQEKADIAERAGVACQAYLDKPVTSVALRLAIRDANGRDRPFYKAQCGDGAEVVIHRDHMEALVERIAAEGDRALQLVARVEIP